MNLRAINLVAWVLVLIGGLNWGLVGLFDYNLVAEIFGADSALADIIYIVVGVSALYFIVLKLTRLSR